MSQFGFLDDEGRTPQGVRGLKSRFCARMDGVEEVAPRKGCVD